MIQRIQTVFLALVLLFNIGFVFTPLFAEALAFPNDWLIFLLAGALTLSSVLSLLAIFQYKNRKLQSKNVLLAMIGQVIALGTAAGILFSMGAWDTGSIGEIGSALLLLIGWICQLLANRAIKKDEKLIKSMDRIR